VAGAALISTDAARPRLSKEKLMQSRKVRPLRLLIVVLVLTLIQVGLFAVPALAHVPTKPCGPDNYLEVVEQRLQDGTIVDWTCEAFEYQGHPRYQWIGDVRVGEKKRQERIFAVASPPYVMITQAIMGVGQGGGDFVGSIDLRNPNFTDLVRRVRVRVIVRYQPTGSSGWYACHDTNWQEAPSPRARFDVNVQQYVQPDCGPAYYEARTGAEFYSTSLNKWVFPGWVYSGSIYISGGQLSGGQAPVDSSTAPRPSAGTNP
jgi:hypothetical protein